MVVVLNCVGNRLITCTWCSVLAYCIVIRSLSATTNFMTKSLVEVFTYVMSVGISRSRGPKFWGA